MVLLVVGLVAVIVVVLIAVFLSIRLGRGAEHDELDGRPGRRGRPRAGAEDPWTERGTRRAAPGAARPPAREQAPDHHEPRAAAGLIPAQAEDWASVSWDDLSDEQYWAELSADKPLAARAKPRRPAGAAGHLARREPAPGRLPVRGRPAGAPAPRNGSLPPARRSYPPVVPEARHEPVPQARHDTVPEARHGLLPQARHDTVPEARHGLMPDARHGLVPEARHDTVAEACHEPAPQARHRPVPGALDDDPLTSPSFSLRAGPRADSRSYRNPADHGATDATGPGSAIGDAAGGYPYGNPYGHPGTGSAGHGSYLADPLRVYSSPGDGQLPYARGYPANPYGRGPAGRDVYPDGYGYRTGHYGSRGEDPYAPDGYGS